MIHNSKFLEYLTCFCVSGVIPRCSVPQKKRSGFDKYCTLCTNIKLLLSAYHNIDTYPHFFLYNFLLFFQNVPGSFKKSIYCLNTYCYIFDLQLICLSSEEADSLLFAFTLKKTYFSVFIQTIQ